MQLVELNHRQQINVIRKHTRRNAQPKKANDLTTPFAPSLISVADLPKVHSPEEEADQQSDEEEKYEEHQHLPLRLERVG